MLNKLVVNFIRLLIRLRYRVVVEGLKELEQKLKEKEGILFLPNHSAQIDPVILMDVLWLKFQPHPVVVEDFFYGRGLSFLMRLVGALPCPNMEYGVNHWKVRQLDKLLDAVAKGLGEGKNYLIYPSGKLKVAEKEVIGGASFIPNLLQKEPKMQIVLIRTTGLWGSSFSCALTGKSPNLAKQLLAGIGVLLKNGIFFTPRRTVKIEFVPAPEDFPYKADRTALNRYLEGWYNARPDPLALVSYAFWKKELPAIRNDAQKTAITSLSQVPEAISKEIAQKISEMANISPNAITLEKQLVRDFGLDSLDIAQILLFLDEKYHVGHVEMDSTVSYGELLQLAVSKQTLQEERLAVAHLPHGEEKNRPDPFLPQGKTIVEAFLRTCDTVPGFIACVDATSGVIRYRKLKITVLLLAEEIRKMPGKNIGIMLPSSCGAYIVILATLCAGKLPVMLNWTVGKKAAEHAVSVTDLQVILSSRRFLSRSKILDIGSAEDKIVLLEDVKKKIGLGKKLRGALRGYSSPGSLLKKLGLENADPSNPAVVLFTSGTEALPKGVPLSHTNILSDQRAALSVGGLKSSDSLFGILPPFHSFGFSVTGLLPLLSGLKVFYSPDPTNHRSLVRDITTYKPTLFFCAPTFVRSLFHAAEPKDLQSLRMIVSGAEKVGKELFDYVKQNLPEAMLLEGYGITECSPIVTLCRPYKKGEEPPKGVGLPLPGIELLILHLETGEVCEQGKEGEVCISGPNVFAGYLGTPKNPFIEKMGKRWYRSGDIGYLATDGSLILAGRLKRFVKIGGEMVSLGGLEEEIASIAQEKAWASPQELALTSIEKEGQKTTLVLFATHPIDKEAMNSILRERGHSNLTRISEVRTVPQIPLTGTGKTNYRLLEETLA